MSPTDGYEIERRFLVDPQALLGTPLLNEQLLRQGYLTEDPSLRVRLLPYCKRAFLTLKGKGTVTRVECEQPFDYALSEALLEKCPHKLRKTRYQVRVGSSAWTVDRFLDGLEPLYLAEIELPYEDAPYFRPAWAFQEVTEDRRYVSAVLAKDGLPADYQTRLEAFRLAISRP